MTSDPGTPALNSGPDWSVNASTFTSVSPVVFLSVPPSGALPEASVSPLSFSAFSLRPRMRLDLRGPCSPSAVPEEAPGATSTSLTLPTNNVPASPSSIATLPNLMDAPSIPVTTGEEPALICKSSCSVNSERALSIP
ncbi:hypothetical protein H0H93_015598, partial [Arthromyces matolae]